MNLKQVHLLLLLSLVSACNGQVKTALPQEDPIKAETKEVITSLAPSHIVRTVIQDRKGNIWMASWEGIFRYDGKSFTNITSKITSARFFSVVEDRKGNFWFGTIGSGVYYYDPSASLRAGGHSFQHFTIENGLLNNEVTSICEDKKGNIWFGVSGGLSCYDPSASLRAGEKSFRNYIINGNAINEDWMGITFPDRKPISVNTIMEDKTGKLWIGTRGDAYLYDGKKFTTLTNRDGKAFNNVWSIIEDKKGNIWFGADGLWRYDPSASLRTGSSTFTRLSEKGALSIIEDKKGNIWTSSTTAMYNKPWTLSRYDEKSLYNEKPIATEITSKQMIFGILEDKTGHIWFGSGDGVYRYDGKTITDFKNKEGHN
jgi:ligand-binding sensor domain-containing protein